MSQVYLGKTSSACQPNPKCIPHVMDVFVARVFPKVTTSDSVLLTFSALELNLIRSSLCLLS